ncbi:MAG TPA: NAD-dependent malic enzyme [Gaiellales bacterium]|nr:NAD-dependent malic enzyme [Gaiellales bacterium]
MARNPSASYSLTMRVEIPSEPGSFALVAAAVAEAAGDMGAIDLVRVSKEYTVRDITCSASDAEHGQRIVDAVRGVPGVHLVNVSDRTFLMHLGGKIEVHNKVPVKTRDDLSMAYTPGVARVCLAIASDREKVRSLTIKQNTVAVVTDGTAVLGLGDIGPEAAMPVMEGKAMLFKEFAGIDAWPIALNTKDTDEIITIVKALAPGFGGINLEDIAAPRCFEIEGRLRQELDIPVFHDDQHGTAVVVLAGLINAAKLVGKPLEELRVVLVGVGAAGVAVSKLLLRAGVTDIVGCDRDGALYAGKKGLTGIRKWYAKHTNPRGFNGTADEALAGADVFIGLSGPGAVSPDAVRTMAPDAIVFAMANPEPEVPPEEIQGDVRVIATGRSDYPNQVNNVLCFPGMFRGALNAHATTINEEMNLAAARAIASVITDDELSEEYVIPSVFNKSVVEQVAAAVADAAVRSGVAQRDASRSADVTEIYR